jgi:probable phosphoglycerate mutase
VRREFNKHADRLANEAMDAAASGRAWTTPVDGAVEVPEPEPEPPAAAKLGWSAPSGVRTSLLLLRHGETALSAERRFSGRGDVALTERGEAQAAAAAGRLATYEPTVVVSSPLRRARQTAEAVAGRLGLDVEVIDGLAETDFGDWEALTFAEVRAKWPKDMQAWLADPDVAPPGGESFTATTRRVAAARDDIVRRHSGRVAVVVSHVTPIKTLVRLALEAPPVALYRLHLDPASLSVTDWWSDGPAVVRLLNDTSYLDAETRTHSG